jgi:hypothetical protein
MFFKIPYKSTIFNDIYKYLETNTDEWVWYKEFNIKVIPQILLLNDPFFKFLKSHCNFMGGVLNIAPNICYSFHTDDDRKASINMLLSNSPSHCIFSPTRINDRLLNIVELVYEPETYYVLNTTVPHMVINFNLPRFMFSIQFLQDISYDDVLEIIALYNFINKEKNE